MKQWEKKLIFVTAIGFIMMFYMFLTSGKVESNNALTAHGLTYKVTSQIKAHKVNIGGTTCIIIDRATGPSVSCDW